MCYSIETLNCYIPFSFSKLIVTEPKDKKIVSIKSFSRALNALVTSDFDYVIINRYNYLEYLGPPRKFALHTKHISECAE